MHGGGGGQRRCGGYAPRGGGRPCAARGGREVGRLCLLPIAAAGARYSSAGPVSPARPRARWPTGPSAMPPTRSVKSRAGASWSHPRRANPARLPPPTGVSPASRAGRRGTGLGGKRPLWSFFHRSRGRVGAQRRGGGRESAGDVDAHRVGNLVGAPRWPTRAAEHGRRGWWGGWRRG